MTKHWALWWSLGLAGQAPCLTQKLGHGYPYLWGHILKRTPLNCVWGVSQECLGLLFAVHSAALTSPEICSRHLLVHFNVLPPVFPWYLVLCCPLCYLCTILPCTVENSQMGRQKSFPCLRILCPSSGWHVMGLEPGVPTAIEPKLFSVFNPRLKSFKSMTTLTVKDLSVFYISYRGYLGSL